MQDNDSRRLNFARWESAYHGSTAIPIVYAHTVPPSANLHVLTMTTRLLWTTEKGGATEIADGNET